MGRPMLLAARGEKFWGEKKTENRTWAGPCGGRMRGMCGRVVRTTCHKREIGGPMRGAITFVRLDAFLAKA